MKNKKDEMKKLTKEQWMNQMEKFLAKKEEIEFNQFCNENKINENDRVNFLNNLHDQGKFLAYSV